jgi:Putative Actinobacterial Holin-X, holin superfamily III
MSGHEDSPRRRTDGTSPADTPGAMDTAASGDTSSDTRRFPRQPGRPDASDSTGTADTARKGYDDMRRRDATRASGTVDEKPAGPRARDVSAAPADHPGQDQRSLGQLVASASRDLSTLVRDEIALAKTELKESVAAVGKGAGLFGAAGFLVYVAFLMLSIAAGYGLVAAGLHPAVSFLIVAGAYLLIAAILAYVGMRKLRKAGPERTIHSIEETKALVGRGNGK